MSKSALKLRELLKRLEPYGIETLSKRGKGSEIILVKPDVPGGRKGPQYPIKKHGDSTEISIPVIEAVLRRFNIDKKQFWGD
ncbi:MAG: type II toxin-antitoxin system HicA family toxin [Deltaproteobacteria bacterium]|nr:type II toxin-antitoxin system HicA family toxin [Deltaproteobacteria bacterium]